MTAPGDSDLVFVEAAQRGDEAAYDALMTRHRQRIFNLAQRYLRDDGAAADVTQEVFVRAWFALPRFKPQAKFSTWLYRIAINLCRDLSRSASTRKAEVTHSLDCEEREIASSSHDPAAELQAKERIDHLVQGIAALPIDLREAFLLAVLEEHPHHECAQILGTTSKAVENRVRRARRRLEEWLSGL